MFPLRVVDYGMTPLQRTLVGMFCEVIDPPGSFAGSCVKATGKFLSSVAVVGGIARDAVASLEHSMFEMVGLDQNWPTRILLYGVAAHYAIKCVPPTKPKTDEEPVVGETRPPFTAWECLKKYFKKPLVVEQADKITSGMMNESARPGSLEQPGVRRGFQMYVGSYVDGTFKAYGSAIRLKDYLVVPEHVVAASMVHLTEKNHVWVLGSRGEPVKINVEKMHQPETDLALVPLTNNDFSKIGVEKANVEHVISEVYGEIVNIMGTGTMATQGRLSHSEDFGWVVYEGTTKQGYSGAPYYKGNRILGVHHCGGRLNRGYSASFLLTVINKIDRETPESGGWLQQQFATKGKRRIRFNGLRDGEVQLRIDGRYHTVREDSMADALGNDWLEHIEFEDPKRREVYRQIGLVNENAENNALGFRKSPGVSSSSSTVTSLQSQGEPASTKQLKKAMKPGKIEDLEKEMVRLQTALDRAKAVQLS